MWNVITVSLRQAIIPDHLLGRVNSVYRFLGWGMMPIGSLVGGLVVALGDQVTSREMALRIPYVIALVGNLLLLAFGSRRLTTAKIEAARAGGKAPATRPRDPTRRPARPGRPGASPGAGAVRPSDHRWPAPPAAARWPGHGR